MGDGAKRQHAAVILLFVLIEGSRLLGGLRFRLGGNEDGKAVLLGKIWKRDAQEPKDWTIELRDPAPNKTGAPGMFGNATNAELFIDNVSVTSNSAN